MLGRIPLLLTVENLENDRFAAKDGSADQVPRRDGPGIVDIEQEDGKPAEHRVRLLVIHPPSTEMTDVRLANIANTSVEEIHVMVIGERRDPLRIATQESAHNCCTDVLE